jgi:hypothetical protein
VQRKGGRRCSVVAIWAAADARRKGLSASSGGRHAWHASEFLKQRAALSSSSFLLLKSFPICLQSKRAFSEHRPRLALDQPPSVASLSGPVRDPEPRSHAAALPISQ